MSPFGDTLRPSQRPRRRWVPHASGTLTQGWPSPIQQDDNVVVVAGAIPPRRFKRRGIGTFWTGDNYFVPQGRARESLRESYWAQQTSEEGEPEEQVTTIVTSPSATLTLSGDLSITLDTSNVVLRDVLDIREGAILRFGPTNIYTITYTGPSVEEAQETEIPSEASKRVTIRTLVGSLLRNPSVRNIRPKLLTFYGATILLTLSGSIFFIDQMISAMGGKYSFFTSGEALFGVFGTAVLTLELVLAFLVDMSQKPKE